MPLIFDHELVDAVIHLKREIERMSLNLANLQAEVAKNTSISGSIVALVNNIAAQLKAIPPSTDPTTQAAIDAAVATLQANDAAIAAAVTANTPASPTGPSGTSGPSGTTGVTGTA